MSDQNCNTLRDYSYRAVIPYYILFDPDLNGHHFRLYGVVEQMESNPNPNVTPTFSYEWFAQQIGVERREAMRIAKKLKDKKYLRHIQLPDGKWIWTTVKNPVIEMNEGVAKYDTPPVAKYDTPPVAKYDTLNTQKNKYPKDINTTTSSTTSFENYKEQEKKNLEEVNEQFNRKQKEEEFKKDSLNDSQCKRIFQQRFSGLDITLEELYQECVDYWSQSNQMVFKARFLTHLKKAPIEKYTALSSEKSNSIPKNETQEERMKRYALERENQKKRING